MIRLGKEGEDIATNFLRKKGYKILDRNYKTPIGEADIIAKDKDTIVFVEVKTRSSDTFGLPFEAVTYRKQEKLKKIAIFYLKQHQVEYPVRFDIVSIFCRNEKRQIEHIKGAF